jgi:hypothetical protein
MSRRLSELSPEDGSSKRIDSEIQRLELLSREAYVGEGKAPIRSRSYLYIDQGVLKFYNASTKETKTVSLS